MLQAAPKNEKALLLTEKISALKLIGHRSLLFIVLCFVCAVIFLTSVLWWGKATQPEPDYFIVDQNKNNIPTRPLRRPNLSLTQLLVWVMEASTTAYTFDFLNLESQLEAMRPLFTETGFTSFQDSLVDMIEQVHKGKLVVSSVPTGMPVVVRNFGQNDEYTWVVQLPLRISFQSSNETRFVDSIQTITIERIPTTLSPFGVGISQIQMGSANAQK